MKKLLILLLVVVYVLSPIAEVSARGGGGHASSHSSSRSSSSRSSTSKSSTSKSSTKSAPKSNARKTSSANVKPGSTVKTSDGKTVKTSTVKPSDSKYRSEAGVTGVDGYSPKFTNRYNAPPGSIVYYRDTSFIDYLPWIYLFGHSNAARANQQATIVQPDGKQVQAKPVAEGTDGLAILNWLILILLSIGLVVLVIWLVNKYTTKEKLNASF